MDLRHRRRHTGSALYDKYLMQHYSPTTVQAWFSFYLVIVLAPLYLWDRHPSRKKHRPFQWRWSIPLIGISLLIADYFYFTALSKDGALISIISILRRSNVLISFTIGSILYRDQNKRKKAKALAGILVGTIFLLLSKN